jgi:DNA mismatch endonuclease, patch repair protein
LPGVRREVDIAFATARVAVNVNGCFWHGCGEHATWPKANKAFWERKILRNRERDAETASLLAAHGWLLIPAWEHEDPEVVVKLVLQATRRRVRLA